MKSLMDLNVLIIGGAGFIGHHMALDLKRSGASVNVVDSLSVNNLLSFWETHREIANRDMYLGFLNKRLHLLKDAGIPLYIDDARDYQRLSLLFNTVKPQVVIHLAAVAHANVSNKNPHSTFDHSMRTLENALDCSRGRVDHFIYFSSSMVYGHFKGGTVTEETPCEPLGIYGTLKHTGEKIVTGYNNVFDLPYTIIRPSALYGERCVSRRVGQLFAENALQGKPISINGNGSDRLDFTYVRDLTAGIKNVIENENSINQVFNLTYGESRSIGQMAEIIRDHFPNIAIEYTPKDKLTPDRGTLSVEKARKLIGYNPQFPLEKGYPQYIRWYQSQ